MKGFSWFLLILLSVIWGGSFFFNKVALSELPPFTVLLGRTLLAALALNVYLVLKGQRLPKDLGAWAGFLLLGWINNIIPFALILWAQTEIQSNLASVLNATTPLWTVLVAHFFTKDEKFRALKVSGVLVGFLGVVVMVGFDSLQGLGKNALAQTAVVAAGLSYAFSTVFGKKLKNLSPTLVATGQLSCSGVLMIPIAAFFDSFYLLPFPTTQTWASLLGLSLISTALAYVIYFRILSSDGATNISLVTFLIPVSASLLGYVFFNEWFGSEEWLGMLLIALGLLLIDGRIAKKLIRRKKS